MHSTIYKLFRFIKCAQHHCVGESNTIFIFGKGSSFRFPFRFVSFPIPGFITSQLKSRMHDAMLSLTTPTNSAPPPPGRGAGFMGVAKFKQISSGRGLGQGSVKLG